MMNNKNNSTPFFLQEKKIYTLKTKRKKTEEHCLFRKSFQVEYV